MGKIETKQVSGESLGFGFRHVEFEMPVNIQVELLRLLDTHIWASGKKIYVHLGVVCM